MKEPPYCDFCDDTPEYNKFGDFSNCHFCTSKYKLFEVYTFHNPKEDSLFGSIRNAVGTSFYCIQNLNNLKTQIFQRYPNKLLATINQPILPSNFHEKLKTILSLI